MKIKNCLKFIVFWGLVITLWLTVFINKADILNHFAYYFTSTYENPYIIKNDYYRDYNFNYVVNTKDFTPDDYSELKNVFYTIINSGQETSKFLCSNTYDDCIEDVTTLLSDQFLLSNINNFVHPYNSFRYLKASFTTAGEVTITVEKNYSQEEINIINEKINTLKLSLIDFRNTNTENIKNIHDYIINTSTYDTNRTDNNIIKYRSSIAYGPLIENYAICGGYTDAMALFLEELGIKNYKVASSTHTWNAVLLDNTWYHLDLTWDDPITNTGANHLAYDYFLIDTKLLLHQEKTEHNFDQSIYSELEQK